MALSPTNAFQLLTFIAAPALLTNASSVLVLSTSNRFARALDRARTLATREPTAFRDTQTKHLTRRAVLLNRALVAFYLAVASFAIGTFSELLGGGLASISLTEVVPAITEFGLFVAAVGTFAIAAGAAILVAETTYALRGVQEEARELRASEDIASS